MLEKKRQVDIVYGRFERFKICECDRHGNFMNLEQIEMLSREIIEKVVNMTKVEEKLKWKKFSVVVSLKFNKNIRKRYVNNQRSSAVYSFAYLNGKLGSILSGFTN